MTKAIVIQQNDTELYFFKFMLGQIDEEMSVEESTSIKEVAPDIGPFMEKIKEYDLLVLGHSNPFAREIITKHIELNLKTPLVLTFLSKEEESNYKKEFKYHALISTFQNEGPPHEFKDIVTKLMKFHDRMTGKSSGYHRVSVKYMLDLGNVSVDVFVQINEKKYVKVIRRFQDFSNEDIEKYAKREIKYLYVLEKDLKAFTTDISSKLVKQCMVDINKGNKTIVPLKCYDFVYDSINSIGLDSGTLNIANIALTNTVDIINSTPMGNLILDILNKDNYISEHSLLLSYIVCTTCRQTEWYNKSNIMRLTAASFFHDMKISNEDVCRISSKEQMAFFDLSEEERKNLDEHPILASEVVKKIKGLPMGVEKVVLNHHEKYDGSGFPRGANYRQIDPLSGIFILAHEVIDVIYEVGFYRDNIIEILKYMSRNYTQSYFPKIVAGLVKAFALDGKMISYDDIKLFKSS